MTLYLQKISSPIGELYLLANDQVLVAVLWGKDDFQRVKLNIDQCIAKSDHSILQKTQQQLAEYFLGQRKVFDLPLAFHGTEFQQQVWQALCSIPFGESRSYLQIAEQIGNKKAVRAVGAAIAKNPISIVVPCHRVIGANGKMVGFAGGLDNKEILLKIEKDH